MYRNHKGYGSRNQEEFILFRDKNGRKYKKHHTLRSLELKYLGRFENPEGLIIVASGYDRTSVMEENKYCTIMFQIYESGDIGIYDELKMKSNSVAAAGGYAYFGNNKMVTRLNIDTGEIAYFTYLNEEEISACPRHEK